MHPLPLFSLLLTAGVNARLVQSVDGKVSMLNASLIEAATLLADTITSNDVVVDGTIEATEVHIEKVSMYHSTTNWHIVVLTPGQDIGEAVAPLFASYDMVCGCMGVLRKKKPKVEAQLSASNYWTWNTLITVGVGQRFILRGYGASSTMDNIPVKVAMTSMQQDNSTCPTDWKPCRDVTRLVMKERATVDFTALSINETIYSRLRPSLNPTKLGLFVFNGFGARMQWRYVDIASTEDPIINFGSQVGNGLFSMGHCRMRPQPGVLKPVGMFRHFCGWSFGGASGSVIISHVAACDSVSSFDTQLNIDTSLVGTGTSASTCNNLLEYDITGSIEYHLNWEEASGVRKDACPATLDAAQGDFDSPSIITFEGLGSECNDVSSAFAGVTFISSNGFRTVSVPDMAGGTFGASSAPCSSCHGAVPFEVHFDPPVSKVGFIPATATWNEGASFAFYHVDGTHLGTLSGSAGHAWVGGRWCTSLIGSVIVTPMADAYCLGDLWYE